MPIAEDFPAPMLDLEVVACSASGKPVVHYSWPEAAANSAFVGSLQALVAFVRIRSGCELRELSTPSSHAVFWRADQLTLAAIERFPASQAAPRASRECLARLLALVRAQILLVLTDRGLDVLRRQPNYDLRELLGGTESVMRALCDRWKTEPTLRLAGCGVPFVRLAPAMRKALGRALLHEPEGEQASSMICGLLLARAQVVALAQPNRKQFSLRVDDLLLLANFVFYAPSLASAETWTPVCLPHFNSRGFLHAYIVFLAPELCMVLLSSDQSPEQFPRFQAKRAFVAQRLQELDAVAAVTQALDEFPQWQPHADLPLLQHFVFKSEASGQCAAPALAFPLDDADQDTKERLLEAFARLHQLMFRPMATTTASDGESVDESQALGARLPNLSELVSSRLVFERREEGLFLGVGSDDHRLLACFDALATVADARDQAHVLLERLKRDEQLVTPADLGVVGSSMWP